MHTAWKAIMSVIFVEFITAVGSRRDLHNFLADDMGPTNQLTLQASCSLLCNVIEIFFNSHWNYPWWFPIIDSIKHRPDKTLTIDLPKNLVDWSSWDANKILAAFMVSLLFIISKILENDSIKVKHLKFSFPHHINSLQWIKFQFSDWSATHNWTLTHWYNEGSWLLKLITL